MSHKYEYCNAWGFNSLTNRIEYFPHWHMTYKHIETNIPPIESKLVRGVLMGIAVVALAFVGVMIVSELFAWW
jgi:hypothetical protein